MRQNCNLCDSKFSNKSNLSKHIRRVHQVENEYKSVTSLECPLCDLTLNVISKLHEHIQKEHDVQLEMVNQVFESVDGKYFHFSHYNNVCCYQQQKFNLIFVYKYIIYLFV